MITSTLDKEIKKDMRAKSAKPLLWIGMASIVMFFGGLTSAVIVKHGEGDWQGFELPLPFWISTVIIILSSIAFNLALSAAKKDQQANIKKAIGATLLLGVAFMITQFMGWGTLKDQGIYLTGKTQQASGSYFLVLTWAHFAHLIGGIISLIVVFVNSSKDKYNSKNLLGLQLSATYWHFLGGLWIYLFIFLNFINQNF